MESEMKFCVNGKCVSKLEITSLNKQLSAAACATAQKNVKVQSKRKLVYNNIEEKTEDFIEFGIDNRPNHN